MPSHVPVPFYTTMLYSSFPHLPAVPTVLPHILRTSSILIFPPYVFPPIPTYHIPIPSYSSIPSSPYSSIPVLVPTLDNTPSSYLVLCRPSHFVHVPHIVLYLHCVPIPSFHISHLPSHLLYLISRSIHCAMVVFFSIRSFPFFFIPRVLYHTSSFYHICTTLAPYHTVYRCSFTTIVTCPYTTVAIFMPFLPTAFCLPFFCYMRAMSSCSHGHGHLMVLMVLMVLFSFSFFLGKPAMAS